MTQHCEVAVVGGGPVGMLVAGELALHGVSVVVLETRTEVSEQPKAGTYHARAIQTLARRGILRFPRVDADYRDIVREPFQFAGYPWLTLRTRAIEGPVMIGLAQADLERALGERAASLGALIRRGHTVTAVRQDSGRVTLSVREGTESRTLTADYAIGCDGPRGIVRESGDFPTVEYPPTLRAMLGMARLPHPEQLRPGWQPTPRGWTLLNLNRFGSSRIITFEFDGPEPDRRRPITAAEFAAAVERITGRPVELRDLEYTSRFSDFTRLVTDYRDGRLFVAGDAAHVHYPLGGQGLNTGLQDAVNLGWKLVSVLRGGANPAMLDSYSTERQPVAARLVENTRVQAMLMNPAPDHDPLRGFVRELLSNPDAHDRLADTVNGESVSYPGAPDDGAWAGEFFPNLTVEVSGSGTRTIGDLLTAGRAVLLTAGTAADRAALAHPLVDVVAVDRLPEGIPPVVLIRPDGYVAWSGDGIRDTGGALRPGFAATLAFWFGTATAGDPVGSGGSRGEVAG
ncbi:FAD-dependent monooxygenase [Nocardia otitidiscaviarum]|uniref:FAD-dependent monooxygenase n=1 Tax=Nocardia otitidiscaviarum TaxID=1823 RepID=UPI0018951C91|nr:FAD-dependent monooxygenase [Nocardia otitidiscaviarum]MBF6179987.1 FAD-dependent monooxygenase [Nocardia otitidiscaviarum]